MKVKNENSCFPVRITLDVIGGKWKPLILWYLKDETFRFSQLHKRIGIITQKMLTQQLRELERDGLIVRKVFPEVPPKVEYKMSSYGSTLKPLLHAMQIWGETYKEKSIKQLNYQQV